MEGRPQLTIHTDPIVFRAHEWDMYELVAFCRKHHLTCTGKQSELNERVQHYLETGERKKKYEFVKINARSDKFDWKHAPLTKDTRITSNYKNTENVRRFFKSLVGYKFKADHAFMRWVRKNQGKTLEDAAQAWLQIHEDTQGKSLTASSSE